MATALNSNALLSTLVESEVSGKRIISHAANRSVRPYSTNQEYLWAMREDLAEWLKGLYAVDINAINFFDVLETGTLLCQHANNITTCADYVRKNNIKTGYKSLTKAPTQFLVFNQGRYVRASSFFARDNIANFIGWCRKQLEISDSVMFETNDLVLRHNEKNVILCLLEVARRGSKFGVPAPVLVQMEEDIDNEIELEKTAKERNEVPRAPLTQKVNCDFKSLDEMVQFILGMCTCPSQFPMVKVADGKYKVGDSANLIFMRILRQHVMVRVGGGWDTLEHYLNKHDPCRCQRHRTERALTPRHSRTQATPISTTANRQSLNSSLNIGRPLANKQLLSSARLAKSSSNIHEISRSEKNDKPEQRRFSSRSRNSSSDATSLEERPASKRNSASVKPAMKTSATKRDRLSLQSDVFSRLSRPKSTPPIQQKTTVEQDDLLVVQRNKKGAHHIQRASTPTTRNSLQIVRKRGNSTERSDLRSKSLASLSLPRTKTTDPSFSSTKPKQRMSLQANLNKTHPVKSSATKEARARSKSTIDQSADRELEMLQAFEKECISNQFSLQHAQLKPRHTSVEGSLEGYGHSKHPSTDCEDNEVALHMKSLTDANTPRYPNGYSSLPRPRKDKRDQNERRSRIPTPVSFQKQNLSSRSIDINNSESKKTTKLNRKSMEQKPTESPQIRLESKPILNGHGDSLRNNHSVPNVLSSDSSDSLESQLNRLLNFGSGQIENDHGLDPRNSHKHSDTSNFDPTHLHSSGYPTGVNLHAQQSAFVPIENFTQDTERLDPEISPSDYPVRKQPQTYNGVTDNSRSKSATFHLRKSVDGISKNSHIRESKTSSRPPPHILQTCGLTGSPCFGQDLNGAANGLQIRSSSTSKSREPQWV